jgi:hypothetical protein
LCRVHYDQERYELATKGSAEDQAAAERERWIEYEFHYGNVSEKNSPHGTNSMFVNDEERRAAWEDRKDKLLAERYLCEPYYGHRPWAWWEFEAGRPDLRFSPPHDSSLSLAESERHNQEYEIEKFTFLAENGYLTDREIQKIAELGRTAKERIDTGWEERAYQSPDYGGDKLKVARADAVLGALKR